ncbi:MAG: hypothetical protein LBS77_04885 [Desulfovibrio sp.]|jgi:hypothetical protein|nr:hypothetical protein [Desulfovibrio sp.]
MLTSIMEGKSMAGEHSIARIGAAGDKNDGDRRSPRRAKMLLYARSGTQH